jgi:3-oxoacyl-[acyl-carrier protein] reductase
MLAATLAMAEDEMLGRIPMKRLADPDEIARIAATLLTDDASYVNGAVIDVDGGYGAG